MRTSVSEIHTIGETCDYGSCSARRRVRAVFVYGELRMCRHHWEGAQDAITGCSSYLHAYFDEEALA